MINVPVDCLGVAPGMKVIAPGGVLYRVPIVSFSRRGYFASSSADAYT